MENEAYALPDLSSTPIDDFELLEEHLRPGYQRYMSDRTAWQAGVNSDLPRMNPWDLTPAATRQEERRGKYFLTTNPFGIPENAMVREARCEVGLGDHNYDALEGFWMSRGLGWVIPHKSAPFCSAGHKVTYDFYTTEDIKTKWKNLMRQKVSSISTPTNWSMNVYSLIDHENSIQKEMVLCHVFENNSRDYDPRPKCAWFRDLDEESFLRTVVEFESPKRSCGSCSYEHSGKPCNEAIHGPSSSSFRGTAPGSLSTHHGSNRPSESEITAYMEHLNSHLLGDDPETSKDAGNYDSRGDENGQSRKRTRTTKSDVWQRFTKIFAHGADGVVVTLAACNHCCKVLTGDSKQGTSHLRRHKCPCNH